MQLDFSGRRVLITGGTRGIGAAIAKGFLHANAHVTVTGRTPESFENLRSKLNSDRLSFEAVNLEINSEVENFCEKVSKISFDVLVNNAGINKIGLTADVSMEDWDRIQAVNVRAPMLITKTLIAGMAARQYGRVVNISSIFGHVSKSKRVSYSTSKFALLGMTKATALDYPTSNVLVNCVSPGFIDTELTRTVLKDNEIDDLVGQVPMKRLGTPDEIAKVVLFLASEQNSFITGQNIIADGGFTNA